MFLGFPLEFQQTFQSARQRRRVRYVTNAADVIIDIDGYVAPKRGKRTPPYSLLENRSRAWIFGN